MATAIDIATLRILLGNTSARITHATGPMDIAKEPIKTSTATSDTTLFCCV